jgi:hypothetical protein
MNLSIGGFKVRVEVLVLVAVVCFLIFSQSAIACSSCDKEGMASKKSNKEGFTSHGSGFKVSNFSGYSLGDNTPVDTSKWGSPSLVLKKGGKPSEGAQAILSRPPQSVPLPEGQMSMFANTEFKPECCPNTYSNGSGCACMTVNQYNYLVSRGGNNVPYSEY